MASFRRALPQLAPQSTASIQLFLSHMSESGSSDEQEVRAMVGQVRQLGFLLPTPRLDDEAYALSIPGVGKLVSAIRKTRTWIIRTLKRTKYKEMHEQQLKKAKLACSCFQLEFHLADMEGCGLIRRTKVTSGILVTLADK
uniref:Uncharacterized protein n=1 Tax=Hyaloperonospora arabidopsidis (strain Emoy2) TaxID=559515 RepID=M4C134_HYAAE